jgi:xanthine phosphoribosyltransferase
MITIHHHNKGESDSTMGSDLRKRIEEEATIKGDIICVDTFLNHQLDLKLIDQIGGELAKAYRGKKVTKVLTCESSGIPIACFTAHALGVPAIYAKRFMTGYMDSDVYAAEIHSFSLEKSFTLRVSKKCLNEDDVVLIVDDILANGQDVLGLLEIIARAGAETAGVAVAVEKANKDGGRVLRQMGIPLYAVVTIEGIEDGVIKFKE